jgi:hypothetical protein
MRHYSYERLVLPSILFDFASGQKDCPAKAAQEIGSTLSLIPAFSPRRRRIIRRLLEKLRDGIG